jgi:NitT/TauT family transport system substrate-binding protein
MTTQTRRQFLTTLSLAGAAGILPPQVLAAEGPLETTTIRIAKFPGICLAPQFIAEPLLRAEGFTEIRYVDPSQVGTVFAVASGQVDIDSNTPWTLIRAIEAREPITVLAGVMVGCYELFANENIRGIADLKGRSVGVEAAGPTRMGFPFLLATHVGLDPDNDIHWITDPDAKPLELFVQGKIDAFLAFPPERRNCARARLAG